MPPPPVAPCPSAELPRIRLTHRRERKKLMNQTFKVTKSVSPTLSLITSLPRRTPATVGRRWACRAVAPRRRDKGASPITAHYPATRKPSEGGSLLTVLLLALCCFGLSPAPNAFGVSPAPDGGYASGNTAEGDYALLNLTSGAANTANGYQALFSDTTGSYNTANGSRALFSNTVGRGNTANGVQALYNNTTGGGNTANGAFALYYNTTGFDNTANGSGALFGNLTGNDNTANGFGALGGNSNTTGSYNSANGS